jgi:hypothetical protein
MLHDLVRTRLDGFHCRCLRRILRIPAAYYSRVSNQEVWKRAGQECFSEGIARDQLLFLGKILAPNAVPALKQSAFHVGTAPKTQQFIRKVGRPRQTWVEQTLALATMMLGSSI